MFPAGCFVSWLFGICLSGYLGSNILVFILASFLAGLLTTGIFLYSRVTKRKFPLLKTMGKCTVLLIISTCSALLYQTYEAVHFQKAVTLCRENPSSLTGVVSGEINRYHDTDYCTITLENGEKVSVKIRTEKSLLPGEKVTLYEPVLSAIQPNNKEAGQTRRLLGNNTFLSATFPYEPKVTRHGIENDWLYGSKVLRNLAKDHFSNHYPRKTAAFLTALLSSDKSLMAEDQYQEFLDTGTVHIVVVSGMHFVFLANALLFLLGIFFKSRRKRLFITLPLLILFAWFTGGTIPVMRSLLMISLLFGYDIFYIKPVKSYVTVLAIACLFLTVTPILIFNPSFLLTFGATFGITAFYEPFTKLFRKVPTEYLRSTLAMYAAVQPFTLPVILLYFSKIPLGSVLANFLVAPLVSPILILAVIGMAVANLSLVGPIVLYGTNLLANLFLFLIHCSAKISHPLTFSLGEISFLLWIGGAVLLFFVCRLTGKYKRIALGSLSAIILMTALTNTVFPFPKNQLTVTFLGAKNTNSAVIKSPADRLILYGSLKDIAYARGSSYDEYASVALIILTELSNSEQTETLLKELPSAPVVCPAKYEHLMKNTTDTFLLEHNLTTRVDGIFIRLIADSKKLYETEFSYGTHLVSFSQDAGYVLEKASQNPSKIWIANFKRRSSITAQIGKITTDFRMLSKKEWHPDTNLYDNYSMLIFDRENFSFYGTKEQKTLWN
ncbi:MAG: ComEC/Rec2 family competence protein [Ruminococcaceae bacterium]|nr:ComEC/Rec2 family competence protein [Oscillospiraceae bacterium]